MAIKAIIGLGNPGNRYHYNRHNIGFRILDALCLNYGGSWQSRDLMQVATIALESGNVILIKPQTFMNTSGKVLPFLHKQGIKNDAVLVVHDELELPFGSIKTKVGGSAKGHNGLKSLIEHGGPEFARLRFGISRPENREHVPDYVLSNFSPSQEERMEDLIKQAVEDVVRMV